MSLEIIGVDIIKFAEKYGPLLALNLIWILIWYLTFRFTAKFIKKHIEEVKDKEIDRISAERNLFQGMVLGERLPSSKSGGKK